MHCKIADLIVEIPDMGGMYNRCLPYIYNGGVGADIIIRADLYNLSKRRAIFSYEDLVYMESGRQFYAKLLDFNGMYLHASAVELHGKVYLFSGDSGEGKSTHAKLWQQIFGDEVHVINDDKPALRKINGTWYAYGTPWCGKDGININDKAPVAGICFLKQAKENKIRRLTKQEALLNIIKQTNSRYKYSRKMDKMLTYVEDLLNTIPVFELQNTPEPDAAKMSYKTMHNAAKEMQL